MTEGSFPIRFRHFIPRDEDLKFFIADASAIDPGKLLKAIESEMIDLSDKARESLNSVAKAPKEPNWDLKRDFERRNKRLDVETLRAIARHAGRSMDVNEESEGDGDTISEQEDPRQNGEAGIEDDDEPAEFTDAMKMMANISPSDLNNAELE
jgi:hypothetical protein